MPEYLTEVGNHEAFVQELANNPGMIVIKFGAEWCGPCKKIEALVHQRMTQLPDNYKCFVVDIDECFDLYAFLKTKRMVNGIPAILAWKKGNMSTIPDAVITSSNVQEVGRFFDQLLAAL